MQGSAAGGGGRGPEKLRSPMRSPKKGGPQSPQARKGAKRGLNYDGAAESSSRVPSSTGAAALEAQVEEWFAEELLQYHESGTGDSDGALMSNATLAMDRALARLTFMCRGDISGRDGGRDEFGMRVQLLRARRLLSLSRGGAAGDTAGGSSVPSVDSESIPQRNIEIANGRTDRPSFIKRPRAPR